MAPRKRDTGVTPGGSAVQRRGRGRTLSSDDDAPGGLQPAQHSRGASPGFTSRSPPPHGRASLGGGAGVPGAPPLLLAEQPLSERVKSLRTRTRSTLLMVAGYISVLYAGHVVVCLFIVCIQVRYDDPAKHTMSCCCAARPKTPVPQPRHELNTPPAARAGSALRGRAAVASRSGLCMSQC